VERISSTSRFTYPSIPFKLPLIRYIGVVAPSNEDPSDRRSYNPLIISSGKVSSIEEAIEKMDIASISLEELDKILSEIVKNNESVIREHGTRVISILMGNAMKTLRGKVAGQKISNILEKKIQEVLKSKN